MNTGHPLVYGHMTLALPTLYSDPFCSPPEIGARLNVTTINDMRHTYV